VRDAEINGSDPNAMSNSTVSVVVPTRDRPEDLERYLDSVAMQTRLPNELILVDDGVLNHVPAVDVLRGLGVHVVYRRKRSPGVTESRNLGIALAAGSVVILSEDDVVLEPAYISEVMRVFDADATGEIVGVGGIVTNERRGRLRSAIRLAVYVPLYLSALREGRLLRSGFAGEYGEAPVKIRRTRQVDFLIGGVSAFRRSALAHEQFSSRFQHVSGYGQGEDKDISLRMRRLGHLVVSPHARLSHHPAAKHDYKSRARGRATVVSRYLIFKEYLLEKRWHWLMFCYSITSYATLNIMLASLTWRRQQWEKVWGIRDGLVAILRGRPEL
jgi:GT2 family glycosyltransferase